jgi:hypothetical protein
MSSDESLRKAAGAYDVLRQKQASWKVRASGERHCVSIGPTGAAKILHALRPHAVPPWDKSIRDHFEYDGTGESYFQYLHNVRRIVSDVVELATAAGIDPNAIPKVVGRPASSLPKLVDEYHWVTITAQKRKTK